MAKSQPSHSHTYTNERIQEQGEKQRKKKSEYLHQARLGSQTRVYIPLPFSLAAIKRKRNKK